MRIVGVHGVGNLRPGLTPQQAAHVLAGIWTRALGHSHGVGQRVPLPALSMAYYADLLQRPGRQGEGGFADLDPLELELVRAWLSAVGLPEGAPAGRATAPLRQALAWVAKSRGLGRPATEWFVATFFREVAAYLRHPDGPARTAARNRTAEMITTYKPRVVIAHSLGSVVAYEALWAHPQLKVELLVTLGSPLALPHAVFQRLQPQPVSLRGRRPPGVARWVNIADPGDLVALPPQGIERQFDGVDAQEPLEEAIHAFDFHKAANYLATPRLRTLLNRLH
ncbi:hypothetical protein AB0M57_22635 [Streptomyces sp. NPDC051597]|uniref:hypothetical protein n=1 Tax=Streptomyces sp. NPDC051597 TaxID=3155049 RepID=UPI003424EC0F